MFRFKRLLVTGAAGFIGSNFVRRMLEKHDNVKVVSYDKLTYAGNLTNLDNLNNKHNHTFIHADINDSEKVKETLINHKIDCIVHFAAESHVDNSIVGPTVFFETNVMGTLSLIESARTVWFDINNWSDKQCRFHHVSTDEVYGSLALDDAAFTEESRYQPNSPYSASKASSDHIVRSYFHTFGLPTTLSNCSNNYGPYQHQEKLIPTVIKKCLNNERIPVYGNGLNIRDWLYVDDHCDAIEAILTKGIVGETYNVGGNCELDNLSLIKCICHMMDDLIPQKKSYMDLMSFVKDRKGHDFRYAIDNSKIKRELGWESKQSFIELLSNTVTFYIQKK